MGIDLYYAQGSPACRAVLLTARALGITLNIKSLNFAGKEHLTPEYLKVNPQHSVPALVDEDGFVVAESRAIMTYLVDKYAKGNPLYPEELQQRNLVDQRLYFDIGTFFPTFKLRFEHLSAKGHEDPALLEKVESALETLNRFLEGKKYITGANLTVADLTLATSFSYHDATDIDYLKYDNIKRWYATVKSTAPGWEEYTSKDMALLREWMNKNVKKPQE